LAANTTVIYSTHSEYLINTAWLENTYIVRNQALDPNNEDEYSAKQTDITIDRYRTFVATHPDESRYFQPILDALDYTPSLLSYIPAVIMTEGKNDFYTFKFMQDTILKQDDSLNFMPGGGAGSLQESIRMYIGWGRPFIVLLDSDEEGMKQKERYINIFGPIIESRIFTLEDLSAGWGGIETEDLYTDADRKAIVKLVYEDIEYTKKHFNRSIQELLINGTTYEFESTTTENFELALDELRKRMSDISDE